MNQELDLAESLINEGFTPLGKIESLEQEDLFSDEIFQYLFSIENEIIREKIKSRLQLVAKKYKVSRQFNNLLKVFEKEQKTVINNDKKETIEKIQGVPESYDLGKYYMNESGEICGETQVGPIVICHHPIIPIERYTNIQDESEKIKILYIVDNKPKTLIVNKSTIASTQSIIKLSDFSIAVNSENAKLLIKYLSDMEHQNSDKIPVKESTSKLGWVKGNFLPYNGEVEFDKKQDFPKFDEVFGTRGTLEEWVEFYRERRKYSVTARLVMAVSVASILLGKMKSAGFTLHLWGKSDYGKTSAMIVAESIFGRPSIQGDEPGIGITSDVSEIGLQNKFNLYNNIPVFMNELSQIIKTKRRTDPEWLNRLMYLVELGIGRTRATKDGGNILQQNWLLTLITTGETDIHLSNSDDEGAYNRCLSWELDGPSYENASENYKFCSQHYGTPVREVLKHIEEYDVQGIYDKNLEEIEQKANDLSNKPTRMLAAILTADKIFTDIIFKDECYLAYEEIVTQIPKKSESSVARRAYENVISWYVENKNKFLDENGLRTNDNLPIFGKELGDKCSEYVAFKALNLREFLEQSSRGFKNSFDFHQVISQWSQLGYTLCDKGKNQKNVRIQGVLTKCIVLNVHILDDELEENDNLVENEVFPF